MADRACGASEGEGAIRTFEVDSRNGDGAVSVPARRRSCIRLALLGLLAPLLLCGGCFTFRGVSRSLAVRQIESLGGTVEIKRIHKMFMPIKV